MGEPEKPIAPDDFTGHPLLASLLRRAKRDEWFLARQVGYFLRAYEGCGCEAHSCGGCRSTLWTLSQLEQHTERLRLADPHRYDLEVSRGRGEPAQGSLLDDKTLSAGGAS